MRLLRDINQSETLSTVKEEGIRIRPVGALVGPSSGRPGI